MAGGKGIGATLSPTATQLRTVGKGKGKEPLAPLGRGGDIYPISRKEFNPQRVYDLIFFISPTNYLLTKGRYNNEC